MRCPSAYARRGADIDIPMTPMIDIVFQLLIFFVWTAGFQVAEYMLPSRVSAVSGSQGGGPTNSPPPPEKDFDAIVIRILWVGGKPAWRFNDTPVGSLADVRVSLKAIAAIKTDADVILHPERDVPLGHVIDVYDVARLQGFRKLQFAASAM